MSTNTIYCEKPVNMELVEQYACGNIGTAKDKAKSLRNINPECVIKRRYEWVFMFRDLILTQMVAKSNKKFHNH